MLEQRREAIRSRKYLDGAKGQRCTFQIPGVCLYEADTTVACHLRDEMFGLGQKADDLSVADGCQACHDLMDGRSGVLPHEQWLEYALRGLQRTIRRRHAQGLLVIALDAPMARRTAKIGAAPKPSRPIPAHQNPWPPKGSRTITTRPMRAKEQS